MGMGRKKSFLVIKPGSCVITWSTGHTACVPPELLGRSDGALCCDLASAPHSATQFCNLEITTDTPCASSPSLARAWLSFSWKLTSVLSCFATARHPQEMDAVLLSPGRTMALQPQHQPRSAALCPLHKTHCWTSQTDIIQDLTNCQHLSSPLHPQITRTTKPSAISLMLLIFLLIYSKLSGTGPRSGSGEVTRIAFCHPFPLRQEAE